MRKYAREVAFSLIFAYLFNGEKDELTFEMFEGKDLTDEDKEFVATLYNGAIDNMDKYKDEVSNLAKGFKLDRIYKVDLAILLEAMNEIDNVGTPKVVCINEAVDMAKKYSTKKSVGFVNGILAEFIKKD